MRHSSFHRGTSADVQAIKEAPNGPTIILRFSNYSCGAPLSCGCDLNVDAAREYAQNILKCCDELEKVTKPACKRCGGTRVVDDGEIDCYSNGEPYENGPVKCVKDCPACVATKEPA